MECGWLEAPFVRRFTWCLHVTVHPPVPHPLDIDDAIVGWDERHANPNITLRQRWDSLMLIPTYALLFFCTAIPTRRCNDRDASRPSTRGLTPSQSNFAWRLRLIMHRRRFHHRTSRCHRRLGRAARESQQRAPTTLNRRPFGDRPLAPSSNKLA